MDICVQKEGFSSFVYSLCTFLLESSFFRDSPSSFVDLTVEKLSRIRS